jgi:acetolactate synthase-1/2/3 large subunit
MNIKVSDYVANFFINKGIKDVFIVTGGGAMHLNDSLCNNNNFNCIFNHHEQASSMAAEAYTRLSNNLCLVNVTSGPGGTNALTGVLGGWLDSIPMFIISGQVKLETTVQSTNLKLRQLGDQEFDIQQTVQNMTKYSVMITNPLEIDYHLEKAFYLATNGRGGPVWLDIPLDIQSKVIDTEKLVKFKQDSEIDLNINNDVINAVINKIKTSKSPLVYVGSGIRLSNSCNEFIEFIEKFNIPVVTAWNSHDLLYNEHPLYVGRPGTIGTRPGNFIVENCDLLLILGTRLNIRQIGYNYKNFAKKSYKIMVDIDELELNKPTINIDYKINTDLNLFFKKINKSIINNDFPKYQNWIKWCKDLNTKFSSLPEKAKLSNKLNPYYVLDNLFDYFDNDEKIVTGNGSAAVITFQVAKIKKNMRLFTNSGCASMGYALPASIGASIANRGKRIICIDGDGSFQMNIQELQTIKHLNLNIKIIIINNNGYHSIRQTQKNLFNSNFVGLDSSSGISFPDLKLISKAYKIQYLSIKNKNNIKKVEEYLRNDEAAIIELFVDEEQFFEPKSSSRILANGEMVSSKLDDMFPFLDRELYESIVYCEAKE